jgi:hypothetical protein
MVRDLKTRREREREREKNLGLFNLEKRTLVKKTQD